MNLRKEINKFSSEVDKPILYWLLDRYSFRSQWFFVAKCKFIKYGKYNYQCNRTWSPTLEGKALFKQLKRGINQ